MHLCQLTISSHHFLVDFLRNHLIKVQLFWEGHKNLRNLPHGFDIYLVNVKTMRKIAQIFVAFSEKLNFKKRAKSLSWGG